MYLQIVYYIIILPHFYNFFNISKFWYQSGALMHRSAIAISPFPKHYGQ